MEVPALDTRPVRAACCLSSALIISEVSISRLESLLHLSIQMSAAASSDRYKDDVSCTFARYDDRPASPAPAHTQS